MAIDLKNAKKNQERVAEIIKTQRDRIGLSLRDISDLLGYKNNNFLSMVENGHSNPPLGRIGDLVSAYQLPGKFVPIIIKHIYPAAWTAVCDMLKHNPDLFNGKTADQVDKELDTEFRGLLRKYDVE